MKRGCRKASAKVVLSMAIPVSQVMIPVQPLATLVKARREKRDRGTQREKREELRSRAGMTWHLQLFLNHPAPARLCSSE